MSRAKILVVEDEFIIAEDIADCLKNLGYFVVGITDSGEEAIKITSQNRPDLVLMDIMLNGNIDGITAAQQIQTRFQIPVVYLTAYADDNTLQRVKGTKPFGYIIKPFEEKDLHSTIQIALHRHQYDSLTNLPNRLLFRERLHKLLKTIYTTANSDYQSLIIPILSLSLDRINRINGTLGYAIGDSALRHLADKLTHSLDNWHTIARLEGAEFAIILEPIQQKQEAAIAAQTLLDVVSQPLQLEDYEIYVTASIGITFYPDDSIDGDDLIKNAYAAMYHVKLQGGNDYQFYASKFEIVSVDQLALETDIRKALKQEEFTVYYQPQISLKTGQIVGAEALVRWNHPHHGMIYPSEFIPIAEEIGLMLPLGEWILRQVCQQTQQWKLAGYGIARVAANLSGQQFNHQKNLYERVCQILKETGLEPQFLDLEVTEGLVMHNEKAAAKILTAWRQLGIKISIDDFGTGYSSLSYLKKFPFDIIKIDQEFISDLTQDPKNAAITVSIIQLAHNLNMRVVAEGVETEEELLFLCQNNCDEMQGYLFSRPLPADEFEALLKRDQRLPIPNLV